MSFQSLQCEDMEVGTCNDLSDTTIYKAQPAVIEIKPQTGPKLQPSKVQQTLPTIRSQQDQTKLNLSEIMMSHLKEMDVKKNGNLLQRNILDKVELNVKLCEEMHRMVTMSTVSVEIFVHLIVWLL